jgi:hypothetical protein
MAKRKKKRKVKPPRQRQRRNPEYLAWATIRSRVLKLSQERSVAALAEALNRPEEWVEAVLAWEGRPGTLPFAPREGSLASEREAAARSILETLQAEEALEREQGELWSELSETERKHRVAEHLLAESMGSDVAEHILTRLKQTDASPEEIDKVTEAFSDEPDIAKLLIATRDLQNQGLDPDLTRVAARTHWTIEQTRRVARKAADVGLLSWDSEATGPVGASGLGDFRVGGPAGLFYMPTSVVRRFSEIARAEKLPQALTEEEVKVLPVLARHVVETAELEQTEEGHHYVRAKLLLATQPTTVDGRRGFQHLIEVLQEDDLPTAELHAWREHMVEDGILARDSEKGWYWIDERRARNLLDRMEADRDFSRPEERMVDFPVEQFGTLVDSVRKMPEPPPAPEMPIHVGAHSFEAIWQHQDRLWQRAQDLSKRLAELTHRQSEEIWGIIDAEEHSRTVAAGDVLRDLKEARVVTIGIDIAEALPEWETVEEAWEYAQEAYPPFPMTFLDFSTAGGYCPLVHIPTQDGREVNATLRGALCAREPGGPLTIRPFAWVEPDHYSPELPEGLSQRSDYDSPGIVTFGGTGGLSAPGDDITILRIKGPPDITGHVAVLRNDRLLGQGIGGWTEIVSDLDVPTEWDVNSVLIATAHITITAAARALSVLYALDGTVNVELEEATAPRPERRAAERAAKKGRETHISRTVHIRRTRYDNGDRQPTGKRRDFSHAFWRRGGYAYYPLGTRMADALAAIAPNKLVNHPEKGPCRKILRGATIVGATDEQGRERRLVAKSYVWRERREKK